MRIDPPSARLRALFALAVAGMLLHKVECWFAREWHESPFFAWVSRVAVEQSSSPEDAVGVAMFVSFNVWLFVGLAMVLLVLRGGAGPMVALAGWGLTFLLEWHHLVRAVASWHYYPGLWSAVAYVAIGPVYWREWARHVHRRGS